MEEVTAVEPLDGYRLRLTFSDGLVGEVEIDVSWGEMFEPLRDPAYFRLVEVCEKGGTVVWPNGLDLAPDALYERAAASIT